MSMSTITMNINRSLFIRAGKKSISLAGMACAAPPPPGDDTDASGALLTPSVPQSPALCIETAANNRRAFHWPLSARVYSCLQRFCSTLALSFSAEIRVEVKEPSQTQQDASACRSPAVGTAEVMGKLKNLVIGCRKCSLLLLITPKFRSCVAKMSYVAGRNGEHWQDIPVPTTRVKAAPDIIHFAFALVFRGWWQPYTPPSAPVFWTAELILLTWGENSQHHCQCHTTVAGLFHSKTLPAPLLLPKYSQCPDQELHQGLHFNAFMSFFPSWQMLAQEKGIMHMADLSYSSLLEELRDYVGSTRHTRGLPEADQAPAQRPGHHCRRGHLKSCQMSLYMFVHSTASCCSVGPIETFILANWDHISTGTERFIFG